MLAADLAGLAAPALAAASVGVAVGSGTDVAVETADVTLLDDDPENVVRAVNLSEGSMSKIHENLGWALGYNLVMLPLASLGVLQPALAAAAMSLSSVTVLTNSVLLGRYGGETRYWLARLRAGCSRDGVAAALRRVSAPDVEATGRAGRRRPRRNGP